MKYMNPEWRDRLSHWINTLKKDLYRPLGVEESIVLPDWLQGKRLVEATRLGIDGARPVDRVGNAACQDIDCASPW